MEHRSSIDFSYWSGVSTITIWEAAAMMSGADPRAFAAGEVVDRNGDFPDLSDDERRLTSAVRAKVLDTSDNQGGSAPDRRTHVLTASLITWFRQNGHANLATELEYPRTQGANPSLANARRRLDRLRSLGGDCTYDKLDDKWNITGLKLLKAAEDDEGHSRTSEKTLRRDLVSAAEAELQARRTGPTPVKFPAGS